jgi:hypothetical protein
LTSSLTWPLAVAGDTSSASAGMPEALAPTMATARSWKAGVVSPSTTS